MGRDIFFHIDQSRDDDANEKLVSYGDAAEALLNNPAFQGFIRHSTSDLYDRFLSLNPRSEPGKVADVIHSQNILSALVSYLRELKQIKDALEIKVSGAGESGSNEGGNDGGKEEYKTSIERDRERILGISGGDPGVGYEGGYPEDYWDGLD